MIDEPDLEHREKKRSGCLLLGLFGTLVFYILSPGLVFRLINNLQIFNTPDLISVLEVVYFPLEWAYDHFEVVQEFYGWMNRFFEY